MLLRREEKMNLFDLANLLDNDGNLQNEMMVMAFAATLLATIPGIQGARKKYADLVKQQPGRARQNS